jgi:hypothetical protein
LLLHFGAAFWCRSADAMQAPAYQVGESMFRTALKRTLEASSTGSGKIRSQCSAHSARQRGLHASPSLPNAHGALSAGIGDRQTRTIHEIRERVSAEIGITDEDKQEMIKSGISVFDSRTAWAVTYMAQAGLVRRPRRAIHQITERGENVLRDHPDRVDNHLLAQFEEFREFKARARATQSRSNAPEAAHLDQTPSASATAVVVVQDPPRETITAAVDENNAAVASEILERVRDRDPAFLEKLVLKVLTATWTRRAASRQNHRGSGSAQPPSRVATAGRTHASQPG